MLLVKENDFALAVGLSRQKQTKCSFIFSLRSSCFLYEVDYFIFSSHWLCCIQCIHMHTSTHKQTHTQTFSKLIADILKRSTVWRQKHFDTEVKGAQQSCPLFISISCLIILKRKYIHPSIFVEITRFSSHFVYNNLKVEPELSMQSVEFPYFACNLKKQEERNIYYMYILVLGILNISEKIFKINKEKKKTTKTAIYRLELCSLQYFLHIWR